MRLIGWIVSLVTWMASLPWNLARLIPMMRNTGSFWHGHGTDFFVLNTMLSLQNAYCSPKRVSRFGLRCLFRPSKLRLMLRRWSAQPARVRRLAVLSCVVIAQNDLSDLFGRVG